MNNNANNTEQTQEHEVSTTQKVAEMIDNKFMTAALLGESATGKELARAGMGKAKKDSIAAKYFDMPISDILREQRKTENLLAETESRIDSFIDAEYQKAVKRFSKGGLSEDMIQEKAREYVKDYVMGSRAHKVNEPEAYEVHQKYLAMQSELVDAQTESNAVLLARKKYIEDNQDIIKEEQRKKRVADLRKSGLLKELGLIEESEEE